MKKTEIRAPYFFMVTNGDKSYRVAAWGSDQALQMIRARFVLDGRRRTSVRQIRKYEFA
jgi:hypothetical protein